MSEEKSQDRFKINSKQEITIVSDKNGVIGEMFQNEIQSYSRHIHFLNTDILLYFIYGEYINWKYNKERQEFYICRNSDLIDTLTKDEWRNLLSNHKIYYNSKTNNVILKDEANQYRQKLLAIFKQYDIKYIDWQELT
jgi:hypothetical protein